MMKFDWPFFWRRRQEGAKEDAPAQLPATMKAIEPKNSVDAYLDKARTQEGRIGGVYHKETYGKIHLSQTSTPKDSSRQTKSTSADAATRERMMLLLCDVCGMKPPSEIQNQAQSEDEIPRAVDAILASMGGKMDYASLDSAVCAALRPRLEGSRTDAGRDSWRLAKDLLLRRANDGGMK